MEVGRKSIRGKAGGGGNEMLGKYSRSALRRANLWTGNKYSPGRDVGHVHAPAAKIVQIWLQFGKRWPSLERNLSNWVDKPPPPPSLGVVFDRTIGSKMLSGNYPQAAHRHVTRLRPDMTQQS